VILYVVNFEFTSVGETNMVPLESNPLPSRDTAKLKDEKVNVGILINDRDGTTIDCAPDES
jgi:hypothetical protein